MTTLRSGQPVGASLVDSRAFGDLSDAPTPAIGSYLGWDGSGVLANIAPHSTSVPSYGGTYEFNETGTALALTSSASVYRWISGQTGTVKGAGYVTWDNAAAPTGKRLTIGASGAGVYLVAAFFSGNVTLKGVLEAVISIGDTPQNNIRSDHKVIEDAQYTSSSFGGILTLAAGNTVGLWFGSSVNSNTFTIKHVNMTLLRIE
jgi:hypothetical protein